MDAREILDKHINPHDKRFSLRTDERILLAMKEYAKSYVPSLQPISEEGRTLDQMTDEEAITIAQYTLGFGEWFNAVVHHFGTGEVEKIAIIDEYQNSIKHIDDYNKDRDNWNWVEITKDFDIRHRTDNVLYSTKYAYLYLIEKGFLSRGVAKESVGLYGNSKCEKCGCVGSQEHIGQFHHEHCVDNPKNQTDGKA